MTSHEWLTKEEKVEAKILVSWKTLVVTRVLHHHL